MKKLIAIDIGGTDIKYGIVTVLGQILESGKIPTEARLGGVHVMQRVSELANSLRKQNTVAGLAISTAGQVDIDTGVILFASPAIPGYQGCGLKEYLEAKTGLLTEVDNDVNCAMMGECWQGAGQGMRNGLMLTIGTGIGGAIWLNGELYRGDGYSAGEWGYMRVNGQDFQDLASTSALIGQVATLLDVSASELDGYQVYALADTQPAVAACVERHFEYLADGVANLIHIFDPEKIILGGGVAGRSDFLTRLTGSLTGKVNPTAFARIKLEAAQLGNHAGFCGAVWHFIRKHCD